MAARALAGNRSFRTNLALIVGAALVLRVLYTVLAARDLSGLGDYQFFQNVPNLLADGEGFTNPFLAAQGTFEPTALHPPLWPLLLSVSSALGGTSELAHKLVGTLAGTGTVAVIGVLGRRIGGTAVGLTAAGIACVYPVFVGADGSLMSESLYGLLIATVLLLALRLMDRPGPWLAAGLGIAIGLAALTRTEGLAFLVLLALPAAWLAGGPLRFRAGLAAVAIAGALVVVAPWTVRNHEAFGSFVPISTNEGERAERWRRDGLDFMRDHAGRLPKVATARVLRTWGLFPPGKVVVNEGRPRWIAQIETVFYLVLLPLAVAGVFFLRGPRERLVLLAPALIVTLVSAYGWGLTRFRHAADIALVVLAAVALVEIARRLAARRRVPSSAA